MYKHPPSAAASRVFLLSKLDWFFSRLKKRLKQLGFTWFSINHLLEKSVRLKSDHQDLLRSVCFQKLYFHCSSAEEWSSSHIFWGAFISSSLNQHCIALHYMFGSFQSHLTKTNYWRKRVMTDIYIILCQYLLYCYIDCINLHYKHQNYITFCPYKYQHLHQIAYFC